MKAFRNILDFFRGLNSIFNPRTRRVIYGLLYNYNKIKTFIYNKKENPKLVFKENNNTSFTYSNNNVKLVYTNRPIVTFFYKEITNE